MDYNSSYGTFRSTDILEDICDWREKANASNKHKDFTIINKNMLLTKGLLWWKRFLTEVEVIDLAEGNYWNLHGKDRYYSQWQELLKLKALAGNTTDNKVQLSSDHAAILYRSFE